MKGEEKAMESEDSLMADELLNKLFHLKQYEVPEAARMTRNKQNIMRQVREISRTKRKTLGDFIEVSFPWLFAEPKYGVAVLFMAFAGLQYLGINAHHAAESSTGIYTMSGTGRLAAYEQRDTEVSNSVNYIDFAPGTRLFPNPSGNNIVTPAGLETPVGIDTHNGTEYRYLYR